ncbi:MAG: para-nitrobenzyl esterase [Solirubrobacteraceae bacterium]
MQDRGIFAFRGIPYAAAPTGPLRFGAPVRPPAWQGVRDATRFGVAAPQHRPEGNAGSLFAPAVPSGEDCLSLNVWTPQLGAANLPVMVWVHGGGFLFGTGAGPLLDKGTFARDGIVLVSMNYRLGVDGYLFVEDDPASGNYGTLDQIAALAWVQENIAAFGGDATRVTLAGQSAGSTAVSALMAAPAAHGLFSQAVVHSGYPDLLLSQEVASGTTREVYARLGIPHGDLKALRQLRERHPERILAMQQELFVEIARTRDVERFGREIAVSVNPFQPVVGGDVVPRLPVDALSEAGRPQLPLMIGHNREEAQLIFGIGMLAPHPDGLEAAFEAAAPGRGADVLRTYRASRPDAEPIELLAALETDRMYRASITDLADAHARTGAPTFFARFSWRSTALGGALGAGHGVDQPFVFDALDLPAAERLTGPGAPQALADLVHRAWVTYVTSGDPHHDGLPSWPRYSAVDRRIMDFDVPPAVVANPAPDELALWARQLA